MRRSLVFADATASWSKRRTGAGAEIRSRLRELAALKARRERELEAAERALAAKPDREQAQELVDLLPLLGVAATLLAEESFRELLAALDFRATFELDWNELRVRAMLAPELLSANGHGTSSLSSVPPGRTGRKGRRRASAFVQVEAMYSIGGSARFDLSQGRKREPVSALDVHGSRES